jgi:hypothetical protein
MGEVNVFFASNYHHTSYLCRNRIGGDDEAYPLGVVPKPRRPLGIEKPSADVITTIRREALRRQTATGSSLERTRRILKEIAQYSKDPHP